MDEPEKAYVRLSNPRHRVEVEDWPFGSTTCKAVFTVEAGKSGERVARVTENKARTGWNKPKRTTYAPRMVLADGDDGRTYAVAWRLGAAVEVWQGTLLTTEYVWNERSPERYRELVELFQACPRLDVAP